MCCCGCSHFIDPKVLYVPSSVVVPKSFFNRHVQFIILSSPCAFNTGCHRTRWTSALPLEVGQLFVVPRLCSKRHSFATSTMTESTGHSRKPWKTEQITGSFLSNPFAPSQIHLPETSGSDFLSELPSSVRIETPQGRAVTPKHPRSGPVSRYPVGMPTPSPSSGPVVNKEGRVIAPTSFEIVANTAGVGVTTIEPILEPPAGLSNCIVGPLWACFISEILNNRGSLSTDQVRSEISKHFPTRYDLNTNKDDPYGWQVCSLLPRPAWKPNSGDSQLTSWCP